jgi:hypothetical protein
MTIRVQKDRIQFDDYTLFATPTGFSFDGQIIASNFFNFFQGSISGYTTGGTQSGPAFPTTTIVNTIDRFPLTADANATDIADLSKTRTGPGGHSSTTAGYASAGSDLSAHYKDIDRFPFATSLVNAVSIGNLVSERQLVTGHSSSTHGYTTGGTWPGPNVDSNVIERFSFVTDENALDVGDLLTTLLGAAAHSSQTNGYVSGGGQNFPTSIAGYQTIQKFSFAANMNAFNVGNLTANTRVATGQSSTTHGYTSGGFLPGVPAFYTSIVKFPFATDTNASSVGNLTQGRRQGAGQSSITSGYTSGGEASSPATSAVNTIDKFPFATDANATDVGDLALIRRGVAGQQH